MNYIPKTKCCKLNCVSSNLASSPNLSMLSLPSLLPLWMKVTPASQAPSPNLEIHAEVQSYGIPLTNNEARRTKVYLFIIVFVVVVVVVLAVVVLIVIVMRSLLLYLLLLCWLSCCWLLCWLPS